MAGGGPSVFACTALEHAYQNTTKKERRAMFDPRRIVLAVVTLLTLLAAVPQVAAAKGLAPFDATTKETAVGARCGPNLCISNTGIGHATFLGKIRESGGFTVDLLSAPAPGCFLNTGTLTLTGANGDSI